MSIKIEEIPVRDASVRLPPPEDFEVLSTASSDISESLRDRILGRTHPRRKRYRSIESQFEPDRPQYRSTESQYESALASLTSKDDYFEIVMKPSAENKIVGGSVSAHSVSTANKIPSGLLTQDVERMSLAPSVRSERTTRAPSAKSVQAGYGGIQTQSVAIQTSPDLNACSPCPHCTRVYDDSSDFDNSTEDSTRTPCTCKWTEPTPSTQSSEDAADSDDSYATDFFELPYQNNEEYLRLLRELEHKLVARNRNRVRKTMMEFERRSRQNQNLERPVCEYDSDDASLLRKLASRSKKSPSKKPVCTKCGRNKRVNSDIMQNEKRWDEMKFVQTMVRDGGDRKNRSKVERSMRKSHWQLDPRSGEWIKVAAFHQKDVSRPSTPYGDYSDDDCEQSLPRECSCKKECRCRQKKRR